jgi:hypothetical protein
MGGGGGEILEKCCRALHLLHGGVGVRRGRGDEWRGRRAKRKAFPQTPFEQAIGFPGVTTFSMGGCSVGGIFVHEFHEWGTE